MYENKKLHYFIYIIFIYDIYICTFGILYTHINVYIIFHIAWEKVATILTGEDIG